MRLDNDGHSDFNDRCRYPGLAVTAPTAALSAKSYISLALPDHHNRRRHLHFREHYLSLGPRRRHERERALHVAYNEIL